jgi:hypothetical protein
VCSCPYPVSPWILHTRSKRTQLIESIELRRVRLQALPFRYTRVVGGYSIGSVAVHNMPIKAYATVLGTQSGIESRSWPASRGAHCAARGSQRLGGWRAWMRNNPQGRILRGGEGFNRDKSVKPRPRWRGQGKKQVRPAGTTSSLTSVSADSRN